MCFANCLFMLQFQLDVLSQKLLILDATCSRFQTIKLRGRNKDCVVCGDNPTVTQLIDYEQFCGTGAHDKVKEVN